MTEDNSNQPPINFEEQLKQLEEIVTKMEQGDLPLEDSLKLYELGIKISKNCHTALEQATQRIERLNPDNQKLEPWSLDSRDNEEADS